MMPGKSAAIGVGAKSIREFTPTIAGSSPEIYAMCKNVSAAVPALMIPTRRELQSSPALFLWESRTTNVDVMSVSNTTRPVVVSSSRNSERRRIQLVIPHSINGDQAWGVGGGMGTGLGFLDPPTATALEVQRNEARRIKSTRDLRRERHVFLECLTREREERVELEAWAATMVQAVFRGFLARPRPPRPSPRHIVTPAEANRRLVADLQAILSGAGLPTIPGLGPDGRKAPEGSEWGRGRGAVGGGGGGGGGQGKRSRKRCILEDAMATRMIKVVRGFLGRRRAERRSRARNRERRRVGAERIQRFWRAYRKRMGWKDLESGVVDSAAAVIQARWRGMSCRMALTRRRKEQALWRRRTVSVLTIQTAARRRLAVARYGPRLTLVIARREREARAAVEAARPRRRWKGGAPASATAANNTTTAISNPTGPVSMGAEWTTVDGGRVRNSSAQGNEENVRSTAMAVKQSSHRHGRSQTNQQPQGDSAGQGGGHSEGSFPTSTGMPGHGESTVSQFPGSSGPSIRGGGLCTDSKVDTSTAPPRQKRRASMASSLLFVDKIRSAKVEVAKISPCTLPDPRVAVAMAATVEMAALTGKGAHV